MSKNTAHQVNMPFVTEYGYPEGSTAGTTTTLVKTVKNGNTTLEYAYDNGRNITEVKKNGTVIKSYTYGNTEWKDQLTAFNGETITYDEIGNPLTYRNNLSFTWQNGRQLAAIMQNGNQLATYTYNADGLRTSKTVNGVTTEYYWMNGTLFAQKTGEEYIYFLYDESGLAYGFVVKNNTEEAYYYYEFNLQGDIIGIINSAGTKVVEYNYGAWGDILSITGSMASTIGQKNPLRYRGYYYDGETGLYYVSSRYYDPAIGRWINADGYVSTGQDVLGYNMFAYCENNPINNYDPAGNFKITALFKAVKKVFKVSVTMLEQAIIGGGKKQTYGPKSDVSKTLSKSKIMQSEALNNLDKYIESGKTTTNFEGSVSLYGKDNLYDLDLSYSVGKASYSMVITEETKTSGFWFFKKTQSRYVITITVSDIYDFDEYRTDKSLGSFLNNWGYDMQQIGFIKPYAWEATYTVYDKWR